MKLNRYHNALNLLLHAVLGSVLGFFLLHPAMVIILNLTLPQNELSFKHVILDCLSQENLPMALYFSTLGFLFGLVEGIYSHYAINLQRKLEQQLINESADRAYEQFFQKSSVNYASQKSGLPPAPKKTGTILIQAKAVSHGYAAGKALILNEAEEFYSVFNRHSDKHYSLSEFQSALRKTVDQLNELQSQAQMKFANDAASIFSAHLLMLKDESFIAPILDAIKNGIDAPKALLDESTRFFTQFRNSGNPYIQDKINDFKDVLLRIMSNLTSQGMQMSGLSDRIIFARHLFPSDLFQLSSEGISGIILQSCGLYSHLSILAKSLRIPMVVLDSFDEIELIDNTPVLLDAENGTVCLNPAPAFASSFEVKRRQNLHIFSHTDQLSNEPVQTRDGQIINIFANINLLSDMEFFAAGHCDGIGLFRTEFSFLSCRDIPSENYQYQTYRNLVEQAKGRIVTFRVFDLGGDKNFWQIGEKNGDNPLLGIKSIRLMLRNPSLLISQIRAILLATTDCPVRIMFPMVTSLDEFHAAKQIVYTCINELQNEGLQINSSPAIGILLEAPSVVSIIDELCEESDFLSLGTNDFVQYLLAVDRSNAACNDFYVPHHPSVLRSIKQIVDSAKNFGKPLVVCGDMAHQPKYIPFLLGIGIRQLSMEPVLIPSVRDAISRIDLKEASAMAQTVLGESKIKSTDLILNGLPVKFCNSNQQKV